MTNQQSGDRPEHANADGETHVNAEHEPTAGQTANEQDTPSEAETFANDDLVAAPSPEEHAELKDKLLRTLADMENLRRRSERDVEEARKYAVTGFARDLLEVRDNLRRGLEAVPEGAVEENDYMKNLVTGIEMTERSLLAIFERYNVKMIEPERGERFNHNRHQAMFEVPTNEVPPGTIAETMQVGYVISDRLLRPALVGVAKAASQSDGQSSPAPEAPGQNVDTSA